MATMTRDTIGQFAPVGIAAAAVGVTESQVRYWIRKALLSTRTQGFRTRPALVEVEAVRRLAEQERGE
jgi:transposase-like protein